MQYSAGIPKRSFMAESMSERDISRLRPLNPPASRILEPAGILNEIPCSAILSRINTMAKEGAIIETGMFSASHFFISAMNSSIMRPAALI